MNGKINQSPTSDESNSTTNDVQTQQNAKRTKRISNASPTFREHHRRELEIIFLHATLEKCEETSAGIMLAGNLCRFMSPYVNDAHKGTKNSIITIPRRDFDFYSPCTMHHAASTEKLFRRNFHNILSMPLRIPSLEANTTALESREDRASRCI